jgi:hypothetical protein
MKSCRVCDCNEERACEGGCSWVDDQDICSRCMATLASAIVPLDINAGLLLAVHGYLCLALRHPEVQGTTSTTELIEPFVEELGVALVELGLLTDEQLAAHRGREATERPRIVLARG